MLGTETHQEVNMILHPSDFHKVAAFTPDDPANVFVDTGFDSTLFKSTQRNFEMKSIGLIGLGW